MHNGTQLPLQLGQQHATASLSTVTMAPGQSRPLPLQLTGRGSDAGCWELCVRPAGAAAGGHMWGSLVPWQPGAALLTCVPARAGVGAAGGPWMCCAALEHLPLARQGALGLCRRGR